ncbi:MAG: exopolyphosphatase [Bacteroidetes bacterium SW_9_63_38]|nr:MAG: exopolyphosphatase [Bacteroidetes bacterium SW_9_63_38]
MRLATIDIGTNTAQLLVVEIQNGSVNRLRAVERFVRLGEGVDENGRITDAAQNRLLDVLRDHRETARDFGVHQLVIVGTSALRDAANRDDVLNRIQNALSLDVDILSGDAEAALGFAAACSAFDDLTGHCLVVDVGGGSTELIAGTNPSLHAPDYGDAITSRSSLDIGCVRLTERCFSDQPPPDAEIDEADRLIEQALQDGTLSVGPDPTIIGTAGTATALALVDAGSDSTWNALRGGDFSLSHADVKEWRDRLLQLSVDEIRLLHPEAMEGRADVFTVGVMLLDHILNHVDRDSLRVSPHELRHGLALEWHTRNSPPVKVS